VVCRFWLGFIDYVNSSYPPVSQDNSYSHTQSQMNPKQTRRSNCNSKINCNSIHYTSTVNCYLKLKLTYCETSKSITLNLAIQRLINNVVACGVSTRSSVEWYTMLLLSHLPWKWRQGIPPNLITIGLVNSILTQVQTAFSFVFSSV